MAGCLDISIGFVLFIFSSASSFFYCFLLLLLLILSVSVSLSCSLLISLVSGTIKADARLFSFLYLPPPQPNAS